MSTFTLTLPAGSTVCNGKQITFKAPASCTGVTGLIIGGTTYNLYYSDGNPIQGQFSPFSSGAMISVLLDTVSNPKRAYIQNATYQSKHNAISVNIPVANWNTTSKSVTVSANGVSTTNTVIVAPAPASQSAYAESSVICSAQGTNTLTFTCDTIPIEAVTVNIIILD